MMEREYIEVACWFGLTVSFVTWVYWPEIQWKIKKRITKKEQENASEGADRDAGR